MKKLPLIVLISMVLLSLVVAGCGNPESVEPVAPEDNDEEKEPEGPEDPAEVEITLQIVMEEADFLHYPPEGLHVMLDDLVTEQRIRWDPQLKRPEPGSSIVIDKKTISLSNQKSHFAFVFPDGGSGSKVTVEIVPTTRYEDEKDALISIVIQEKNVLVSGKMVGGSGMMFPR